MLAGKEMVGTIAVKDLGGREEVLSGDAGAESWRTRPGRRRRRTAAATTRLIVYRSQFAGTNQGQSAELHRRRRAGQHRQGG